MSDKSFRPPPHINAAAHEKVMAKLEKMTPQEFRESLVPNYDEVAALRAQVALLTEERNDEINRIHRMLIDCAKERADALARVATLTEERDIAVADDQCVRNDRELMREVWREEHDSLAEAVGLDPDDTLFCESLERVRELRKALSNVRTSLYMHKMGHCAGITPKDCLDAIYEMLDWIDVALNGAK